MASLSEDKIKKQRQVNRLENFMIVMNQLKLEKN